MEQAKRNYLLIVLVATVYAAFAYSAMWGFSAVLKKILGPQYSLIFALLLGGLSIIGSVAGAVYEFIVKRPIVLTRDHLEAFRIYSVPILLSSFWLDWGPARYALVSAAILLLILCVFLETAQLYRLEHGASETTSEAAD